MIDEISGSNSDSLTEKNVTLGSNELGRYGPQYKDDKIEYVDPKEEAKKLETKKVRPKTPPKALEPLISNFGPKQIPLANIKDKKAMTGTLERTRGASADARSGIQTTDQFKAPKLTIERVESMQTPAPLMQPTPIRDDREESKTPKEAKLLTPGLTGDGGFAGGEFAKALKDAKDTKDYNFLSYKKE